MKHIVNRLSRFTYHSALGLFIIRLAAGMIFFVHGWEKLNNLPRVSGFFMSLGLPGWVAGFIAFVEVIGGIMLIAGFATRVAGIVLALDMLAAMFLTGIGRGFHAHEFEMLLLAVSAGIALIGSGAYSLMKMECNKCGGMLCDGDCN
ncbi:MAG: DoxX family protein [Candidatus Adlerbacteria bacterium]|nr:DoxX family protein [Candidatus Adlerbacteria bacterium]